MISEYFPDPDQMSAEALHECFAHGTPEFPVACFEDDLPTGAFSWHWHDDFELGIVTEGNAIIAGGDRRERLEVGDFFFFRPASLHAGWPADECPSKDRTIVFHPKLVYGFNGSIYERTCILPYRSALIPDIIVLRGEEAFPFSNRFRSAWDACVDPTCVDPLKTREELTHILYDLTKKLPELPGVSSEYHHRAERAKQMLHYIDEHMGDSLSTPSIAASASISVSECLRCFHMVLGMTPMKYVKERRLQTAAELLEQTDLPINEIGAKCGFEGMSYFSKVFREHKGVTPTKWREERR